MFMLAAEFSAGAASGFDASVLTRKPSRLMNFRSPDSVSPMIIGLRTTDRPARPANRNGDPKVWRHPWLLSSGTGWFVLRASLAR